MSQGQSTKPKTISAAELIDQLGRGVFKPSDLAALSDLGRSDARLLAASWTELPLEVREKLIRQLSELAENDVLQSFSRVFRIALSDTSMVVRQLAIVGLWEDESTDLIEIFISMMNEDESADVRAEAATALGRFARLAMIEEIREGDADRVRKALRTAATNESLLPLVRRRALESLAVFGSSTEVGRLIDEAFDSDDTATKASAIYAMGRTQDRTWLGAITREFESPDAEIRFEAARASGEIGMADAVTGLSRLLQDDDTDVRFAAISALGTIGGSGAKRVLTNFLQVCRSSEREAVDEAISESDMSF